MVLPFGPKFDRLGVVVLQDTVQKYGGATSATVPLFVTDLRAMLTGPRSNHPSIVQYQTFNEGDYWRAFITPPYDAPGIVALTRSLSTNQRLIYAESGGNTARWPYHIGDVDDYHSYAVPLPADSSPSGAQYVMMGEFGGMKLGISGKEWRPRSCMTQAAINTSADMANMYVSIMGNLLKRVDHLSVTVYTQTTDIENDCDGFLNYDRSNKFSEDQVKVADIRKANQDIIVLALAARLWHALTPPPPPPSPPDRFG